MEPSPSQETNGTNNGRHAQPVFYKTCMTVGVVKGQQIGFFLITTCKFLKFIPTVPTVQTKSCLRDRIQPNTPTRAHIQSSPPSILTHEQYSLTSLHLKQVQISSSQLRKATNQLLLKVSALLNSLISLLSHSIQSGLRLLETTFSNKT